MNLRRRIIFRLVAMVGAGQVFFSPLRAQEAANPAGVPSPRSPVESFRELLALTPNERKKAVAERPPETQKLILAKVREYQSLRPDERELRLRATELRWYLLPLMNTPATNRAAQLAAIPPPERKLIEERLVQWDRLAPAAQKELLENELTARYFTQFEMSTRQQQTNLLAEISPKRRAQLEQGMARWRALSEEQRRKTCERFDRFFELAPREREKALETLTDAERQQMDKTLRTFEKMPKPQREICVRSFEKFAGMNLEERQQFFKNAERWVLMSKDERKAWRDVVAMVPGWPPSTPPLPPGFPVPVATNAN